MATIDEVGCSHYFLTSTVDIQAIGITISYSLAMRSDWVGGFLNPLRFGKFNIRISYSTSKEMEIAI